MHIFDYILMFIVVVASIAIVYYRARGGSVAGRSLPRGLPRFLAVLISTCVIALFIAYRLFGVLPAWPFHLSLAGVMSVLAVATYLDYKHKPTI